MALSEEDIQRMARARVEFRRHAFAYVVINIFLATVWWLTTDNRILSQYWPVWVHLGWGLGLAFNGWHVYGSGGDAVRREEQKLRERHGLAK